MIWKEAGILAGTGTGSCPGKKNIHMFKSASIFSFLLSFLFLSFPVTMGYGKPWLPLPWSSYIFSSVIYIDNHKEREARKAFWIARYKPHIILEAEQVTVHYCTISFLCKKEKNPRELKHVTEKNFSAIEWFLLWQRQGLSAGFGAHNATPASATHKRKPLRNVCSALCDLDSPGIYFYIPSVNLSLQIDPFLPEEAIRSAATAAIGAFKYIHPLSTLFSSSSFFSAPGHCDISSHMWFVQHLTQDELVSLGTIVMIWVYPYYTFIVVGYHIRYHASIVRILGEVLKNSQRSSAVDYGTALGHYSKEV